MNDIVRNALGQTIRRSFAPGYQPPGMNLLPGLLMDALYPGGYENWEGDLRDTIDRNEARDRGLLSIPPDVVDPRTDKDKMVILAPNIRARNARKYMEGSKVTNPDGSPLYVFHGTTRDDATGQAFERFDMASAKDLGVHFGTAAQANDPAFTGLVENSQISPSGDLTEEAYVQTKENGRVMGPFILNIQNPLEMPDLSDWSPSAVINQLSRQRVIGQQERDYLQEQVSKTDRGGGNQILRDFLMKKGFDGIRYYNTKEFPRTVTGRFQDDASDGHPYEYSYIIFDPKQAKSIYNRGYFRRDKEDFLGARKQPSGLLEG